MEEISYSRWDREVPDRLKVDGSSFDALFNARFPDRPKGVMKSFLDAFATAAGESIRENRFPKLNEVQERMEKGEVYSVKRRFMEGTEFFDETSMQAVGTYLKPRAREFVDASGRYSSLVFDFERGVVQFPEYIRKVTIFNRRIEWTTAMLILFVLVSVALAASLMLLYPSPQGSVPVVGVVTQNLYMSSDATGEFMMLEVFNPSKRMFSTEISLPAGMVENVNAMGGIISVSHGNRTNIKVTSGQYSQLRVDVSDQSGGLPILLSFTAEKDLIATPTVNGLDEYSVKTTGNTTNLEFVFNPNDKVLLELELRSKIE